MIYIQSHSSGKVESTSSQYIHSFNELKNIIEKGALEMFDLHLL